ncbi:MAG TPA: haloacid dehalogenase-like hydrolase [Opitutaceae bacterium]
MPRRFLLGAMVLGLGALLQSAEPEPHAEAALRDILAARDGILAARGPAPSAAEPVFLAVWDFDGTILHGDCSEGLVENDRPVYAGLAQLCIERGLSSVYRPEGGVAEFWKDYRYLDERVGHWLAYPFIPQILRGAGAAEVRTLAREHFTAVLRRFYYASSLHMLRGLEAAGVHNLIISASADVFVDAAASTLNLPEERFHGIALRIDVAGRLTSDVLPPLTWAEGKRAKLLELIAAYEDAYPKSDVIVLAAFGNSYGTDGAFLEHVARQPLPSGQRSVVLMINGGAAPERYRELFREVEQRAVVGSPD